MSIAIRYADADATGRVGAAQCLRYTDENLASLLSELRGLVAGDPAYEAFVVAETEASFMAPILPQGQVMIACTVAAIGRSSVQLRYVMRVNDKLVARVAKTLVAVDGHGRPRAISKVERTTLLQRYLDQPSAGPPAGVDAGARRQRASSG